MGHFQRGYGLFARHRRKRVEELVEAVIPLEVIDQIPEWHSVPTNTGVPPRISGSLWITATLVGTCHLRSDLTMG